MAGGLLDEQHNNLLKTTMAIIAGIDYLTLLADGWKNCSYTPITSMMVATVDTNLFLKSFNVSGVRKTGGLIIVPFLYPNILLD